MARVASEDDATARTELRALAGGDKLGLADLLVGTEVRARDIAIGPDPLDDLRCVAPGDSLKLGTREIVGIGPETAFCAAEGRADDCKLPCHPNRQRRDLPEVEALMRRVPPTADAEGDASELLAAALISVMKSEACPLPSGLQK